MRAIQTTKVVHKAIQIPVRVANVVKSSNGSTGLTNACPDCEGDVGLKNVCKGCSKEISYGEIQKKYKITESEQRILTKDELEELNSSTSTIKVIGSITNEEFKSSMITGSYFILPQTKLKKKSEQKDIEDNKRSYAILRESILLSDEPFTVKFAIRQKEKLGVFVIEDNAIVLLTLAFGEYIQEVDEDLEISLSDGDKAKAKKFVESIAKTKLAEIKDTYNEKLERILSGKPQEKSEDKKEDEDMWGSL